MPAAPSTGALLTIRIRQHAFSFPARYQPGHPLTEAEAHALNQLLAENIRNNLDGQVAKAIEALPAGQTVLPAPVHASLAAKFQDYAARYQFALRAPGRERKGPIELELEGLALAKAEEFMVARGLEWEDPAVQQTLAEALLDPELSALARERINHRQRVAQSALADLV